MTKEILDWIELAKGHEQKSNIEEAVSCYKRAIALAPNEQLPRFQLGNLYWNIELLSEAEEQFIQLLKSNHNPLAEAELYIIQGRRELQKRCYKDAYRLFESASEIFQSKKITSEYNDILLKAYEGMGNAKYRDNQLLTAKYYYQKALELSSDNKVIALHNLALCAANLGDMKDAEKLFKQALKYEDDADCWQGLGDINKSRENWKDAVHCYQKALNIDPNHVDAHFALGLCLLKLSNINEAKSHLERAGALNHSEADEVLRDVELNLFLKSRDKK